MKKYILFMLALLLSLPYAHAEEVLCNHISKVPYVITRAGNYCLFESLELKGAAKVAIDIRADNVNFQLNSFAVKHRTAEGEKDRIGIRVVGRKNVKIENGAVIGFSTSVAVLSPLALSSNINIDRIRAANFNDHGVVLEARMSSVINSIFTPSLGLTLPTGAYAVIGSQNINDSAAGIEFVGNTLFPLNSWYWSETKSLGLELDSLAGVIIKDNIIVGVTVGIDTGVKQEQLLSQLVLKNNYFRAVTTPVFPQ